MILFQISDCEVLNRQLLEETDAMRARSSGISKSNKKGWHSDPDFFRRTEPGCTTLRNHILEAVGEAIRRLSPNFDFKSNQLHAEGWINVNNARRFQRSAQSPQFRNVRHILCQYSARLCQHSARRAQRRLRVPRSARRGSHLDRGRRLLRFRDHPEAEGRAADDISFLSAHWVYPNEEESERVSIAFNIRYHKRVETPAPAGARS
jgi:hypothetical protein